MKGAKTKSERQSSECNLNYYSQDDLPLKSKIALLSFCGFKYLDWIEKILLFWEYAQLISQSLLLYSSLGEQSLFEKTIIYCFKLVNPSSFLEFKESSSFAWSMIILMLVITGLKYLLMGYIVYIAYCNKEGQPTWVIIWRWLFRLQARFICFFLTSFWAQTILKISDEGSEWVQVNKTMIIVMLSVLIAGEYMISFLIEMQFCDLLPRKNFLSGKNNEMQLRTLTQKMAIQVLELALKSSMTMTKLWIYSVINLSFSIWRCKSFVFKLPLYHSKALYLMGNLISLVIALHLVSFIGLIVRSNSNLDVTMQFIIVLWILIGVLGIQISQRVVQRVIFKLLFLNDNPEFLLNKIIFSKELGKFERLPQEETIKYHFTYFFRAIEKVGCNLDDGVEGLLLRSQHKDPLTRVYIAKLLFKQYGICFKALRTAGDILTKPWSKEYTSYILLLDSVQKASLKARKKESIDLTEYLEKQKLLCDLKSEMIQQVQMKTIICQNILNKICDIGEIFDKAQSAWKSRIRIENKIYNWMKNAPEYWTAPLLIFSEYYLILEYSSIKCKKYQEMYAQRFWKNEKHFESSKILKENIYQDLNVFLSLEGLDSQIRYSSKSIEEVCGGEKKFYEGFHVSKLFVPSQQSYYKDLIRRIIEEGEVTLLQKMHKAFLLNKKGYIFEANFFFWIHPYILSERVRLNMILRPMISSEREFLLIKKNGEIEGASKSLSHILGLRTSKDPLVDIKVLSEELATANEMFNLMLTSQKKQDGSQFLTGKEVNIITLTGVKLRYHCRMMSLSDDLPFIKIVSFTKLRTQNYMIGGGGEVISYQPQERIETNPGTERHLLTISQPDFPKKSEIVLELNKENENDVQDFVSTTICSLSNIEEGRTFKELKRAMIKKTHSGLFRVLCLKFYSVVILTLVCQLILKRILNSTMEDLVIKKDLLNYAQTRAYYACKMPFAIATSYLLSTGINVYSFYAGGVALPPIVLLQVLSKYYLELAAANNNIIQLLGDLDNTEKYKELFEKDVRIFGSINDVNDEGFSNFTNFQAVEQLGIPVRYLLSSPDPIAPSTTAAYKFVRKNALGDFLTKNQQVTQIFQESVMGQRDELSNIVRLCIVLNPVALVMVCLILNLIILSQYFKEKKHLKAFIKLDKNYIGTIADNMKDFKQALLDDRSFEDKQLLKAFWDQSMFLENLTIENNHVRHHSQRIISLTKTRKRYLLFAIQMGMYIAILVGVLLWSFLTIKSSLNIIYSKQSQLQLSNYISERTNVDIMAMVEMFISNNTLNVSGMLPEDQTTKAVKEIGNLMDEVLTGFQEYDGSYNPTIKKIVFEGEPCSVYDALYTSYCMNLQSKGILTNLVALLTHFEGFMKRQLALYENMHAPSDGDLIVGLFTTASDMSSTTSLLSYIAQRLNGIIGVQLAKSISDTRNKQNLGMIIFTITLVIVSLLIWIQILAKIKETNNDFKKVLQTFPPKLVASSFLLKNFLDKFSKSNFDL